MSGLDANKNYAEVLSPSMPITYPRAPPDVSSENFQQYFSNRIEDRLGKIEHRFNNALLEKEVSWNSERKSLLKDIAKLKGRTSDLNKRLNETLSSKDLKINLTNDHLLYTISQRIDVLDAICGCDSLSEVQYQNSKSKDSRAITAPPASRCTLISKIKALEQSKMNSSHNFKDDSINDRLFCTPTISSKAKVATIPFHETLPSWKPNGVTRPHSANGHSPRPPSRSESPKKNSSLRRSRPSLFRLSRTMKDVKEELNHVRDDVDTLHEEEQRQAKQLLHISKDQTKKIFNLEDNISQLIEEASESRLTTHVAHMQSTSQIHEDTQEEMAEIENKIDELSSFLQELDLFRGHKMNVLKTDIDHRFELLDVRFHNLSGVIEELKQRKPPVLELPTDLITTKELENALKITVTESSLEEQLKAIKAVHMEVDDRVLGVENMTRGIDLKTNSLLSLIKQMISDTDTGVDLSSRLNLGHLNMSPGRFPTLATLSSFQSPNISPNSRGDTLSNSNHRNNGDASFEARQGNDLEAYCREVEELQRLVIAQKFSSVAVKDLEVEIVSLKDSKLKLEAEQSALKQTLKETGETSSVQKGDLERMIKEEKRLKEKVIELEAIKNNLEAEKVILDSKNQSETATHQSQMNALETAMKASKATYNDALSAANKQTEELRQHLKTAENIRMEVEKEKSDIHRQLETNAKTLLEKQAQLQSLQSRLDIQEQALVEVEKDKELQVQSLGERLKRVQKEAKETEKSLKDTIETLSNNLSTQALDITRIKREKEMLLQSLEEDLDNETHGRVAGEKENSVLLGEKSSLLDAISTLEKERQELDNKQMKMMASRKEAEALLEKERKSHHEEKTHLLESISLLENEMVQLKKELEAQTSQKNRNIRNVQKTPSNMSDLRGSTSPRLRLPSSSLSPLLRGATGSHPSYQSELSALSYARTSTPGRGAMELGSALEEKESDMGDFNMSTEFPDWRPNSQILGDHTLPEPLPDDLMELLAMYRDEHTRLRKVEQIKSKAKMAVKSWLLDFESQHGTPPTQKDKREVMQKYVSHYEASRATKVCRDRLDNIYTHYRERYLAYHGTYDGCDDALMSPRSQSRSQSPRRLINFDDRSVASLNSNGFRNSSNINVSSPRSLRSLQKRENR